MKQYQINCTHRDTAVGEVEHGFKKHVPAKAGDPVWPYPEGEVEHIHNLTLHEWSVRAQGGHRGIGGLTENEPVAKAVHNIAEGAGGNERKANQHANGDVAALQKLTDPPAKDAEQHKAENGKKVLPYYPAKGHAEGHTLVLHKHQLEPVAQHGDAFSKGHVGFDQDFYDLVNDHKQDAKEDKKLSFILHEISRLRSK